MPEVAPRTRGPVLAALAAGTTALAGLFVLHNDAHRLWTRLLHPRVPPLIAISAEARLAALLTTATPALHILQS